MRALITFLLLSIFNSGYSQTTEYYRHLAYNHVSPHVPVRGVHKIDKKTAQEESHYEFRYMGDLGLLKEIINHHYHEERKHPLTHFGAYRIVFEYPKGKEIRTFYDKKGRRMKNLRGVFKEVYSYGKKGRESLAFYNLEDKPMESNWNIASYKWSKKRKRVIEKRFNLKDEEAPVSPYFKFGTTAIVYDKRGYPKAHYNLDENLKITNSGFGVASYKDTYDEKGNHTSWKYYDKDDKLILNPWRYAIGINKYDEKGNKTEEALHDDKNKFIRGRSMVPEPLKFAKITKKDSIEIKEKALGYLKALRNLDSTLMKEVMHPKLAKRTQGFDRQIRSEIPRETTYKQMVEYANDWNNAGDRFPTKPKEKAVILDAYHTMASVKLISDNWIEYLHFMKLNDKWKILNMTWQYKDTSRYPR